MCIYVYQLVLGVDGFCPTTVVSVKIKMKARFFVVYLQSSSS